MHEYLQDRATVQKCQLTEATHLDPVLCSPNKVAASVGIQSVRAQVDELQLNAVSGASGSSWFPRISFSMIILHSLTDTIQAPAGSR